MWPRIVGRYHHVDNSQNREGQASFTERSSHSHNTGGGAMQSASGVILFEDMTLLLVIIGLLIGTLIVCLLILWTLSRRLPSIAAEIASLRQRVLELSK